MQDNIKKKIQMAGIVLLVIVILGYAYFRTRDLLLGVNLSINGIKQYETYTNKILNVTGNAKRAVLLTINDRKIFITENGDFNEELLLLPGYNIIDIKAEDRFGKIKEKMFKINLSTEQNIIN